MKGLIYYYSDTGNTELAIKYLTEKINQADFKMIKISSGEEQDIEKYDIVGFAFPTHYLGVEEVFETFIANLKRQQATPAFLLNTYGMMQGKALKLVSKFLNAKDYKIIAWHALMMPENFPPFITKGWSSKDMPDQKQMIAFDNFINELSLKIDAISKGKILEKSKVKIGLFNSLMGVKSKEKIRKDMGLKCDEALCSRCGRCKEHCYYNAIKINEKPEFDLTKCRGCWSCFNLCPQKAINTDRIAASHQYCGPDSILIDKFLVTNK